MGIRADRYKAMVPVVRWRAEAQRARASGGGASRARAYPAQAQDHVAGANDNCPTRSPMRITATRSRWRWLSPICSTRKRARSKRTASTSSSSTSRPSTSSWAKLPAGASKRCIARSMGSHAPPPCTSATATASRPTSTGRTRSAANGGNTRRYFRRSLKAASARSRSSASIHTCRLKLLSLLDGKDVLIGVIDVATDKVETPRAGGAGHRRGDEIRAERKNRRLHQLRHGADAARHRRR